jgi:hypothetical protein
MQVIKLLQSLGELEELWLVFLVFQEEELTVPDKELSETCVVVVACLLPLKHGEDGTEKSTLAKEDMPSFRLWLLLQFPLWFRLEVTESIK